MHACDPKCWVSLRTTMPPHTHQGHVSLLHKRLKKKTVEWPENKSAERSGLFLACYLLCLERKWTGVGGGEEGAAGDQWCLPASELLLWNFRRLKHSDTGGVRKSDKGEGNTSPDTFHHAACFLCFISDVFLNLPPLSPETFPSSPAPTVANTPHSDKFDNIHPQSFHSLWHLWASSTALPWAKMIHRVFIWI